MTKMLGTIAAHPAAPRPKSKLNRKRRHRRAERELAEKRILKRQEERQWRREEET